MRLATCLYEGAERVAIALGDGQLDLLGPDAPRLVDLLQGSLDEALLRARAVDTVSEAEVDFLPPIPRPDKILCIGLNYRDHAAEGGHAVPDRPAVFARFPGSQVGHRTPVLAPSNSDQFDFEGELAVIIGSMAWRVREEDALEHVAGYSCFADNSVRDFQSHSRQVTPGKNFHASGAFGPWLTSADEVPDPAELEVITRLNGNEMQHGSVSQLIFSIPYLISYISSFTKLLPGDVIATGTPAGVGMARKPPIWMKPGDELEIEIPRVGRLLNTVAGGF